MRKILTAALAAAVLGTTLAPAGAAPIPGQGAVGRTLASPSGVEAVQYAYGPGRHYAPGYYGPRAYGPRVYGPRYGYRPYYRERRGNAAAAGIAGLAAGALIGGAIASSQAQPQALHRTQDPDFIAACSRRYRSFDPVSGTYLGRDGVRRVCEFPG